MQKALCIFFALMMVVSMFAVLGLTAAAADLGDLPSDPGNGSGNGNSGGSLLDRLKAITADQILNIPANLMADVTTYIFQALRLVARVGRFLLGLVGVGVPA